MLKEYQYKFLFPHADLKYLDHLNKEMKQAEITTQKRVRAFLAQTGHECAGYTRFEENLNYSGTALKRVFGKYFENKNIIKYEYEPEKIANIVYANRMGNTNPGDGWKYHGRGVIQLTGKWNYTKFSESLRKEYDVLQNPETILTSPELTVKTGTWYWSSRFLNRYADVGDMKSITRRINGGLNGYTDRMNRYTDAEFILNFDTLSIAEKGKKVGVLGVNSRGKYVKVIQSKLGIFPDGLFGNGTKRAVQNFQKENNLLSDGVVGKMTVTVLFK